MRTGGPPAPPRLRGLELRAQTDTRCHLPVRQPQASLSRRRHVSTREAPAARRGGRRAHGSRAPGRRMSWGRTCFERPSGTWRAGGRRRSRRSRDPQPDAGRAECSPRARRGERVRRAGRAPVGARSGSRAAVDARTSRSQGRTPPGSRGTGESACRSTDSAHCSREELSRRRPEAGASPAAGTAAGPSTARANEDGEEACGEPTGGRQNEASLPDGFNPRWMWAKGLRRLRSDAGESGDDVAPVGAERVVLAVGHEVEVELADADRLQLAQLRGAGLG